MLYIQKEILLKKIEILNILINLLNSANIYIPYKDQSILHLKMTSNQTVDNITEKLNNTHITSIDLDNEEIDYTSDYDYDYDYDHNDDHSQEDCDHCECHFDKYGIWVTCYECKSYGVRGDDYCSCNSGCAKCS